jgi:hypothetical protein
MKLKKSLLSLALLPLLLSCQQSQSYCLQQNGDLAAIDASNLTYESVTSSRSIDELLSESDLGHPILLAITSKDCSHCANYEPEFTSFVVKYQLDVSLLEEQDSENDVSFWENLSKLEDHFSSFDWSTFGTPSLVYFCQEDIRYFQQGQSTFSHLENTLKGQASPLSGLTRYQVEANIPYGKDEPCFLYDRNNSTALSFYDVIWAKAKSSSKVLRLVDYGAMDQANQTALLTHFGLTSYQPLFIADHVPYLLKEEKEMASATSYLTTYYQ